MCVLSYNRKRVRHNFLTCFKQSQNSSEVLTGELPSHWLYNFMKFYEITHILNMNIFSSDIFLGIVG